MQKQLFYSLIILISLSFLTSCEDDKTPKKIASTGGANEILIITQNNIQWKGELGDSIRAIFAKEMPVLSIAEPEFSLVNINQKSLEKQMFKAHHNLFIVDINQKFSNAYSEIKKDLWSSPQIVIKINSPTHEAFLAFFEKEKEKHMELFRETERIRIIKSYASKFKNINVARDLRKTFNLEMNIPKGYTIAVLEDNFAWIRKETTSNSMSILVYTIPYTDTNAFNANKIRLSRDLLTKVKIPGPTYGSYQKVADEFIPVQERKISFNGHYATELRGLWEVANDFMGGPFLSYTFVDESKNRLITVDGFMYAPKQKKTIMLRELEAILWSTKIIED